MQTQDRLKAVNRKRKPEAAAYEWPTGVLEYKLTNDFLFKKVFQNNKRALKGLLCALLGCDKEQIRDLRVLNPITEGTVINDKAMILDIKVEFNDDSIVDIEMQVENERNWEERSLSYLCRNFDQLEEGENII